MFVRRIKGSIMKNNKRERDKTSSSQSESVKHGNLGGLNELQLAHLRGELDVYASIPQEKGDPLPSLADQWKLDYRRRFLRRKP